jgi:hypothetical protein
VQIRVIVGLVAALGASALIRSRARPARADVVSREVSLPGTTEGAAIPEAGAEEGAAASAECPPEMALVRSARGRSCIDRYEASLVRVTMEGQKRPWPGNRPIDGIEREMRAVSRAGVKPQGFISGEQARIACANSGKRLCNEAEWSSACRGARDTLYPYGNARQRGRCNDRFRELTDHPVQRLFRAHSAKGENPRHMWRPLWMNDARLHELPRTVSASGSFPECSNELAVFDMVGNLHEWVDDPRGVFAGGYFMDTFQNGEGCEYRTRAHAPAYHDYSTGFRCCADAAASEGPAGD